MNEKKIVANANGEDDDALQVAKKFFGITYLFPWQRLVIANILDATGETQPIDDGIERSHQIVLLPTGAGKSVCFLVPALLLECPTLVLYPLLALMNDQQRRMSEGGVSCVVFKGQQSNQERQDNFQKIKNGTKVILANPEVLQDKKLLANLSECAISHIAIDEAHCVSEWGDSFRPAYLTLGNIIKTLGTRVVTAFTATASPVVLDRIAEVLFDNHVHLVRGDSDRPNIHYYVKHVYCKEKKAAELTLQEQRPLIIFCSTRKRTQILACFLTEFLQEDCVRFYHAGLLKEEKADIEKWFYAETDAILVSTCAFGMGVDKKNIRTVIHLDSPPTVEAYIQEAGRGGRDGSIAKAILLWSPDDTLRTENLPQNSRNRVLYNFAFAKNPLEDSCKPYCRRQIVLQALGGEETVCSGCDVCEGNADFFCQEQDFILQFAKKNRRKLHVVDFIQNLKDALNQSTLKLYQKSLWEIQDVKTIVEQLLKEKKLQCKQKGFYKNYIDI